MAFNFSNGTVPNNITLNGLTFGVGNGFNNALMGDNLAGGGGNNFTGTITLSGSMNNVGSSWSDKYTLLSGQVTGTGGLEMDDYSVPAGTQAGWVQLSNPTNNFQGGVVDNGCTLQLNAANVIPSGAGFGNVTIANSNGYTGNLNLNGNSQIINGLFGAGNVSATTGSATLTVGNNSVSSTFTGILQNNGGVLSLTKTGAGTLTLGGANTFTGVTLVSGGTLTLTTPLALQGSTFDTTGPGLLNFGTSTALTLGGLQGPNNFALQNANSAALALTVGTNSSTFNGSLTGPGSLIKTGTGFLVLNGTADSYSGTTTINGGLLEFTNAGALSSGSRTVTINYGGSLAAAGAYPTVTGWLNSNSIVASSAGAIAIMGSSNETINMSGYSGLFLVPASAAQSITAR